MSQIIYIKLGMKSPTSTAEMNPKIVVVKVSLTDSINKMTIPGSKITKKGIYTKSNDELMYLDKIEYISTVYNKEQLLDILKEDNTVICYAMNVECKMLIKSLIDSREVEESLFKKYTGVDCDFIESFTSELLEVNSHDYTVLDYDLYFKSKTALHPLIGSRNMFFYKDMPKGIYYTYSNKENLKKAKGSTDSIDIQKTRMVLGKKSSTNIYTVYKIKEQEILDKLYSEFRELNNKIDYYTIMLLDRVTSSKNNYYRDKLNYKLSPKRLESPSGDVLISEIMPAGISYYAFQTFYELTDKLNDFINNPEGLSRKSSIDITDLIYRDGEVIETSDFIIDYPFMLNDKKYLIPIVSGLDLPTRNKLKSIQKQNPRIHLLIENIDNVYCRYYTILEVNSEYMLVGNYPSNIVLLEDK